LGLETNCNCKMGYYEVGEALCKSNANNIHLFHILNKKWKLAKHTYTNKIIEL